MQNSGVNRQLKQSIQQNEALIVSRKKAVHTITHELRTPLTTITGYTELLRKECSNGNNVHFLQSIQQSSDRMRDMLNTLLDFFRLDNGKEQPRLSPCRISTIAHTLETEFMPIAMNRGLSLTVKNENDAVVLTDKERIIQIGNKPPVKCHQVHGGRWCVANYRLYRRSADTDSRGYRHRHDRR